MTKIEKLAIVVAISGGVIAGVNGLVDLFIKINSVESPANQVIVIREYILSK